MLKFCYKNRGAISIFLLIILVPMLTLASIYVDLSRIELAKAVVKSSGELTLNTALTDYDSVLKDIYGLFATAQNVDELFESLEDYYRSSLKGAGVAEVDANDYVDAAMTLLKSEAGKDDLMNLALKSFEIESPTGANLANPAVLKNQIVEFMKFRAPINMGMGLIEGLNGMKDSKKQAQLVDDKNDFYEKEYAGMMEKLEGVWTNLQDYMYRDNFPEAPNQYGKSWGYECAFPGGKYLDALYKSLYHYFSVGHTFPMDRCISYSVDFLYFANDTAYKEPCADGYTGTQYYGVNIEEGKDSDSYTQKWIVTTNEKKEYKVEKNPASDDLETLKEKLKTAIICLQQVSKKKDQFYSVWTYTADSHTERIRQVALFNRAIEEDSGLPRYIDALIYSLVELKNSYNGFEDQDSLKKIRVKVDDSTENRDLQFYNEGDTGIPSGTDDMYNFINTQLKHLEYKKLGSNDEFTASDNDICRFDYACRSIKDYYDDSYPVVEAAKDYVKSRIKGAYDSANNFYKFVDEKRTKLSNAITILNSIKTSLNDPTSDYNEALKKWKDSAEANSEYSVGKNDLDEIERLKDILTVDKITELTTRLSNAKYSLDHVCNKIDEFEVLGVKWRNLEEEAGEISWKTILKLLSEEHINEIEHCATLPVTGVEHELDIPTSHGTVVALYDSRFSTLIGYTLYSTVKTDQVDNRSTMKLDWDDDKSMSPDLVNDQKEMYSWLYHNFFDKDNIDKLFGTSTRRLFQIGPADDVDEDIDFTGRYAEYKLTSSSSSSSSGSDDEDGQMKKGKDDANNVKKDLEKGAGDKNEETKGKPTAETPAKHIMVKDLLPSGEWGQQLADIASANAELSSKADDMLDSSSSLSMLDDLIALIADMGTDLRDDLYITDYIVSMFSYATYEAELEVKQMKNPNTYQGSWYEFKGSEYVTTTHFEGLGDTNKAALKEAARTLTLQPIDPNHNYYYGKEVEYILYGPNQPVEKVFGTIYLIRFALNTIYAFTDAEINSITTTAATALFGCPPLTPLIPIAKIAFTIGISLAESAYDLYMIKQGAAIPLIKNTKTWVMKPSGLGKKAASVVVDKVANKMVDEVVDAGTKLLNDIMDMTDEELEEYLENNKDCLTQLAAASTESIATEIKNYGTSTIQEAMNILNGINNELMLNVDYKPGKTPDKINMAIEQLDNWMSQQTGDSNDPTYVVKKTVVDYLKENNGKLIGELFDCIGVTTKEVDLLDDEGNKIPGAKTVITSGGEDVINKLNGVIDSVQQKVDAKVNELISKGIGTIEDVKDKAMKELREAANEGAETLRKKLKGQIKEKFGSAGNGDISSGSVVASLLSWTYSDYLKVFLMVGLIASPETLLLRTADVIETNINMAKGRLPYGFEKDSLGFDRPIDTAGAFKLSKSYTYLRVKTTVDVEPLLLKLPLFDEYTKDTETKTTWHEINFQGTLGY